jgi:hypothetical protein
MDEDIDNTTAFWIKWLFIGGWVLIIIGAIVAPPLAVFGAWLAIASMVMFVVALIYDKGKGDAERELVQKEREREYAKRAEAHAEGAGE